MSITRLQCAFALFAAVFALVSGIAAVVVVSSTRANEMLAADQFTAGGNHGGNRPKR